MNLIRRQRQALRFADGLVDMGLLDFMIRVIADHIAFALAGKHAGAVDDAVDFSPFKILARGLIRVRKRLVHRIGYGLEIDDVAFADTAFRGGLAEAEDDGIPRFVACPVQGTDFRGPDLDACDDVFVVKCHKISISAFRRTAAKKVFSPLKLAPGACNSEHKGVFYAVYAIFQVRNGENQMEFLYEIQLDNGAKYKARGDDSLTLKEGDWCVIRKDFFLDYGRIVSSAPTPYNPALEQKENLHPTGTPSEKRAEIPRIQRKATVVDQGKAHENLMRSKSAMRTAAQFIERLALPMKLINAHYSFDNKLLAIQFSADGRVDFRELVKQLSSALNTRIELRQIGVRDETAIVGGISICGRPLCCCSFLKEFASINVKMAKEQDLSLTPSTISGICGRLKCCLKYEHEGYLELERTMPRRGDCCECKEGRGRIIDRNLLTQRVVVQLDDSGRTVSCSKDEVSVVYPEKYKVGRNRTRDRETPSKEEQELSKLED